MKCNRSILTAFGATVLVVASVAMTIPAQATPSSPAATASARVTSDRISGSIDGATAVIDVKGIDGSTVFVKSGGNVVAGTVVRNGIAHMLFPAPNVEVDYSVFDIKANGAETAVGSITLGTGRMENPVVTSVVAGETSATAQVSGTPGALVRVQDPEGKVVGMRLVGSDGTTRVTVPVDKGQTRDSRFFLQQSLGGSESSSEAVRLVVAPKVEILDTYEGAAVVKISADDSGTFIVRDADGKLVFTANGSGTFSKVTTIPLTKGVESHFSVVRKFGEAVSKTVDLGAIGSNKALPTPKGEIVQTGLSGLGPWIKYTTVPYASIVYVDADGATVKALPASATGIVYDKTPTPGTYRALAAMRDSRSVATTVTFPEN